MLRSLSRSLAPLGAALVLALVGLNAAPASAASVTQAFTYQGMLQESGNPATGNYDFRFRLFDASAGGAQIGSDVTVINQSVLAGVFSDTLNFGAGAFGASARWLEIGVRPGGSAVAYTTLNPRQNLTATPVALYALNAASGGTNFWSQSGTSIFNNTGTFVGVNRSNRITGSEYFGVQAGTSGYGGMYINTTGASGQPFYGYEAGANSMWTYYDGSTDKWFVHNGTDLLTVQGDGNVGIGDTTPTSKLQVTATATDGITASSSAAFSNGIHGTGLSAGVRGDCGTSDGAAVYGVMSGTGTGVRGDAGNASGGAGVAGYSNFGTGVYGQTSSGYGVYGSNGGGSGFAGYFNGKVHVQGTLSKLGGSFKIDNPLDPANKYLSHSFVESPDMMNIYNGNITTDADGRATITMPEWFEALNRDFRYQITPVGQFAQAMVEKEMVGNRFVIRTDKPNVKVSWQVTGVRHDAYANAHRIPVVEEKSVTERGHYLFPEGFGARTAPIGSPEALAQAANSQGGTVSPAGLKTTAPAAGRTRKGAQR